MNYVTNDIMLHFGVGRETALDIQDIMDRSDLDFSECTVREYRACMQEAYIIYMNEEEKY